jgi:hypothetical protein
MKRISIVIAALIVLAGSVSAQSLVELAKQEKARRESFKGRHAQVIRAADLLRVQKVPGVQVAVPEPESGDTGLAEGLEAEPAAGIDEPDYTVQPSGSGAPSRRIMPAVAPNGPLITGEANRDQAEGGGTLEAQLKATQEQVDLLTTKMAALRQQFEAQDAMVPGSVIQQQMDETNQRLLKAQAQQARIEAMMGKTGTARKAPGEPER